MHAVFAIGLFVLSSVISLEVPSNVGGQTNKSYYEKLAEAAWNQKFDHVVYDGSYYKIPYPGGDVPDGIGVCTDVVIRAYRELGTDLQVLIHRDMKSHKAEYDRYRKTAILDASIDHRRTQNQETFFRRHGGKLSVTDNPEDYRPGDLVYYDIAYGHVGVVTHKKVPGTNRYLVIHNIGGGNQVEDFLFAARIIGHYRWKPN